MRYLSIQSGLTDSTELLNIYGSFVDIYACKLTCTASAGNVSGIRAAKANVSVVDCEINGVPYAALHSSAGSLLACSSNTGSGNGIGLCAANGILLNNGTAPDATTAQTEIAGGRIFS